MAKPGRKQKPTYLKVFEGNPGGRKLNPLEPYAPETDTIEAPHWFDNRRRELLNEVCRDLRAMKGLRVPDRFALYAYVDELAYWEIVARKRQAIGENTIIPIRDKDGNVVQVQNVPFIRQVHEANVQCLRFEREFGLTPSSRASIIDLPGGGGKGGDDDPYAV